MRGLAAHATENEAAEAVARRVGELLGVLAD